MLFDDGEKKAGLEGVYISFLGGFVLRESDRPLRQSKGSSSPFCSAADGVPTWLVLILVAVEITSPRSLTKAWKWLIWR